MNKGILSLTPETISVFISLKTQKAILGGVSNYLITQKKGAAYWNVTDDIDLIKTPDEMSGCKRFRAVVPANHNGKSMSVLGFFIFCPDNTTNKEAIQLAKQAFGIPIHSLS